MITKICTRCSKALPATNQYFNKCSDNKSGLQSDCKDCSRERFRKYYLKNKNRLVEKSRKFRKENPELWKAIYKQSKEKNKEKISLKFKQYYYENIEKRRKLWADWYEINKDKSSEYGKKYKKENKNKVNVWRNKRRQLKKNTVSDLSIQDWIKCLEFFNFRDAYTGKKMKAISQDHIIPLSKGGGYTKNNIVPCEKSINSSKLNKDLMDWYTKQPFFDKEKLQRIYQWIN